MYYLRVKELPQYIKAVSHLCIVDGKACRRNQKIILQILQEKDCRSLVPLVQSIDGMLSLWWPKRAKWIGLKIDQDTPEEERKTIHFFVCKLELFSNLCVDNFAMAIGFIRSLFNVMDMMQALLDPYQPSLKSGLCQLLCSAFMDPIPTGTPGHQQRLIPFTTCYEPNCIRLLDGDAAAEEDTMRRFGAGMRVLMKETSYIADPRILKNMMAAVNNAANNRNVVHTEVMKTIAERVLSVQGSRSCQREPEELAGSEEAYEYYGAILEVVWKLVQSEEYKCIGDLAHLAAMLLRCLDYERSQPEQLSELEAPQRFKYKMSICRLLHWLHDAETYFKLFSAIFRFEADFVIEFDSRKNEQKRLEARLRNVSEELAALTEDHKDYAEVSVKLNDELTEAQKELDQLVIKLAGDWHVEEGVLEFLNATDVKEAMSFTRVERFVREEQEHEAELNEYCSEVPKLMLDEEETHDEDEDVPVSEDVRLSEVYNVYVWAYPYGASKEAPFLLTANLEDDITIVFRRLRLSVSTSERVGVAGALT